MQLGNSVVTTSFQLFTAMSVCCSRAPADLPRHHGGATPTPPNSIGYAVERTSAAAQLGEWGAPNVAVHDL